MRYALLLALIAGTRELNAQGVQCWAPSHSEERLAAPDFAGTLSRPAAMARMRDDLVGTYRLVVVTTEGSGSGRWLVENRVTFRPRSPIDTAARIGFWRNIIADGVVRPLRAGDPAKSIRAVRDTTNFQLAIGYTPPDGLTLVHFDPRLADAIINDDPRPVYRVVAIDSAGTLSGRWSGGGIAGVLVDTPAGRFGEMPSGYFCAFREQPRRSP